MKKIAFECPYCHKTGRLYFRRNSYVCFVCFCGVLVTAESLNALKRKLKNYGRDKAKRW